MYYFENHPTVDYDLGFLNAPKEIQNPLVRYKIQDILKNKIALYYTHTIEEGQSIQFIADRYYDDVTLDWVIYITNDIIHPVYDLPLDYENFINFIKAKYGGVESALNEIHHYEWIIQTQSTLFDGTVIPEKTITVDSTTYASLAADEKRTVSSFTYEERLNEQKRKIKILHRDYLDQFLNEVESILS
jgi:hypothetical protein